MSIAIYFTQSTKHSSGTLQWGEGYNCPPETSARECLKAEIVSFPYKHLYRQPLPW